MDLGPHAAFIWLSYGIVSVAIAMLVLWLWRDGRRQRAALKALEESGVSRRRSAADRATTSSGARS